MNDAAHALPDDGRHPHLEGSSGEAPKLTHPVGAPGQTPVDRPLALVRPRPAAANTPPERSVGPTPWTAAASSIPRLKLELPPPPPSASTRAAVIEEDEARQEAAAGFPEDAFDSRPAVVAPPRALDEPLWVVALEALRSSLKVQIVTLAVILIPALAWMFWPRSEPGISLHDLKAAPARWDGQIVRVNGRVGDVFHVGAGCVFNLHQGRDTIVVFTRGVAPRTRDKISVAGAVSTGYMDGLARQAIFVTP